MSKSITPSLDYQKRERAAPETVKSALASLRSEADAQNWTFQVGYTRAMDCTIEQITGLKIPSDFLKQAKKQNKLAKSQMKPEQKPKFLGQCAAGEAKFNWADHGVITPPKDQGLCGSCWAFATHGAYEGSFAILNNMLINTSEQDTLDCSGAGSCGGGWWAFQYLIDTGTSEEEDYPYDATQETCKTGVNRPYKAVTWGYVTGSSEIPGIEEMKQALCEYGPLAVAVEVTSAFQAYTGGVFNEHSTGNVNHGVTLIGWDDTKEAWRIKNSWGEGWGEAGFMWIAYDSNSIGYAASWTQAAVADVCKDGPSLLAYEQFYYVDGKQFSSNANVTEVTFNLPKEMYVSIVADASARMAEGSPPMSFTTGIYQRKSPNSMWTASFRKGSFESTKQHVPVHTSVAMKLPAGTHTMYWKIWVNGYTIGFDSGTLTVLAVPCSMGGQLKMQSSSQSEYAEMIDEDEQIITAKDVDLPDVYVTINRAV